MNFFVYLLFCFQILTYHSFLRIPFKKPYHFKLYNYKYEEEYYEFYQKYHSAILTGNQETNYTSFAEINLKKYLLFEKNYHHINELNNQLQNNNDSFTLGLNRFADCVDFKNNLNNDLMSINKLNSNKQSYLKPFKKPFLYLTNVIKNKKRHNWNDTSYLSPVKNQLNCGSCWAFSTTSSIETFMRINHHNVTRLSEQELVDCSKENNGCNGGIMHKAFDYVISNKGLHSNDDYRYKAEDNNCTDLSHVKKVVGSNITNYDFIIPESVLDIMLSVQKNPVAIGIDANNFYFRFYQDGVIDLPSNYSKTLNHAVLLVGYDYDDDGFYWIIQNSWGESWGDRGFCKLRMKENDVGTLMCQMYGVYPIHQ